MNNNLPDRKTMKKHLRFSYVYKKDDSASIEQLNLNDIEERENIRPTNEEYRNQLEDFIRTHLEKGSDLNARLESAKGRVSSQAERSEECKSQLIDLDGFSLLQKFLIKKALVENALDLGSPGLNKFSEMSYDEFFYQARQKAVQEQFSNKELLEKIQTRIFGFKTTFTNALKIIKTSDHKKRFSAVAFLREFIAIIKLGLNLEENKATESQKISLPFENSFFGNNFDYRLRIIKSLMDSEDFSTDELFFIAEKNLGMMEDFFLKIANPPLEDEIKNLQLEMRDNFLSTASALKILRWNLERETIIYKILMKEDIAGDREKASSLRIAALPSMFDKEFISQKTTLANQFKNKNDISLNVFVEKILLEITQLKDRLKIYSSNYVQYQLSEDRTAIIKRIKFITTVIDSRTLEIIGGHCNLKDFEVEEYSPQLVAKTISRFNRSDLKQLWKFQNLYSFLEECLKIKDSQQFSKELSPIVKKILEISNIDAAFDMLSSNLEGEALISLITNLKKNSILISERCNKALNEIKKSSKRLERLITRQYNPMQLEKILSSFKSNPLSKDFFENDQFIQLADETFSHIGNFNKRLIALLELKLPEYFQKIENLAKDLDQELQKNGHLDLVEMETLWSFCSAIDIALHDSEEEDKDLDRLTVLSIFCEKRDELASRSNTKPSVVAEIENYKRMIAEIEEIKTKHGNFLDESDSVNLIPDPSKQNFFRIAQEILKLFKHLESEFGLNTLLDHTQIRKVENALLTINICDPHNIDVVRSVDDLKAFSKIIDHDRIGMLFRMKIKSIELALREIEGNLEF